MTLHSRFFRFVSAVCCGTLVALPLQNGYVSSAAPDAATTLANSLRALQDGENTAPRDHWDPKYVEAQLGNDPARTFAWVRDHTYWIPYHGILRGPVGVLMDRQGDSLDRALLLATMLKDEGQTVRLAHGTMPAAQAAQLLSPLLTARIRRAMTANPAAHTGDDVSAVATKYGLDPTAVRTQISAQQNTRAGQRAQLNALSESTSGLMAAAGTSPADLDTRNVGHAQAALADHWWVEAQTGGAWHAFDVLSRTPARPLAVPDRTVDPASIPTALYHQVTVRLIIERWTSGSTTETAALEQTFQPAQVIGTPITLAITPNSPLKAFPAAGADAVAAFRAYAAGQHEWTPTLDIGKQHIVQNAITDSGGITVPSNDTDVLAVAKGVTHGLAGAIDDVFGSGPPATAPAAAPTGASILSAAWIEYVITAPGEPVQTVRRQVFDLPGPAARAAKSATWRIDDAGKLTRGLSLMMTTDILPMNCAVAPQFVEHLSRQTLLANASLAQDLASHKISDDYAGAQAAGNRIVKVGTSLYGLAEERLNSSPVAPLVYVDRPDVLTRHLFVAATGNTLTPMGATDIVANGVGIDPTVRLGFAMSMAQGVYDTVGEAVLYSSKPNAGNAAWAYSAGGDWITVSKAGDPALAALPVSADVRARIDAALASNHLVILPRGKVSVGGAPFAGWWQVDKATGETLGMGDTGWGQDLAEFSIIMMATVAGWGFVQGWLNCRLAPNMSGPSRVVAGNLASPFPTHRWSDVFEARVEARSDNCLAQAFLSAGLALIGLGMAGLGEGGGGGGSNGSEGEGNSLPEDDLGSADTQPMPAVGGEPGGTGGGGGSGGTGGSGTGAGGGSGGAPNGSKTLAPDGWTNPGPEEAAKFKDAQRRFNQLQNTRDVNGKDQALKEMIRNQGRPIPKDMADALDQDIQKLAQQRAGAGFGPDAGKDGGKVILGDPGSNTSAYGKTQPVPVVGDSRPTLQSAGNTGSAGSAGSGSAGSSGSSGSSGAPPSGGSSGGGSGGSGTGGGTLPGLGPGTGGDQTPPTLRSAGVSGSCAPNCGPSTTPTLVGLGGAIGALGGS